MPRRVLHLLPTERQVERALAEGHVASSWRSFLGDVVSASGLRPATPEMTRLATAIAVERSSDELGWGKHGASLVSSVDQAIGVLRRSGVDAALLRRTRLPRGELFATLLDRIDELISLSGTFDVRQIGYLAAASIGRTDLEDLPTRIVIDGLFDWDPASFAWVEALARRIPVTVRMPRWAGPASSFMRAPDAILSHLEAMWQQLSRGPDLELFELGLPRQLALVEAATDAAEARAIAGSVLDVLLAGASPEGIAILVPALDESFLEPLRAALDEANIPFAEPRGRPPIAAPAVRAALGWLDLAVGPLGRDALVDLLRSSVVDPAPFIDGAHFRVRHERALALCRKLSRIPVGADRDGTLLLDLLSAETADRPDEQWMLDSTDRILAARRTLGREASRGELVSRLSATWDAMGLGELPRGALEGWITALPGGRVAQLRRAQIREQAAGMSALVGAAERVVEAADALGVTEAVISAARLRAEIEDALAGVAPVGTQKPGAVRIVRAAEVAGLRTEFLIVARNSEGVFERPVAVDAVLGGELMAALPAALRPLSAAYSLAADRTRLLSAMGLADRLLLTRSAAGAEGRPDPPSALFAEQSREHAVGREPASVLHTKRASSSRSAELCALAAGGAIEDQDLARRVGIERERLRFFLDPRMAATPVTGAILTRDEADRERLCQAVGGTRARPIAATAIERASQCRFAAFALGVLGASTAEDSGEELEPWQRGSLVHRALDVALEAVRPHWGKLGAPEFLALGRAAARRLLVRERSSPLYRAEIERALRDVDAVLEWSFADTGGFRFVHGERPFGETAQGPSAPSRGRTTSAPWPALAIGRGDATVFVKGRIDRIDISPDGLRARIIDYKTGALPAWKDVGTLIFQPPLYARALHLQMGPLSMPEIRAFYLDTSKRPPRAFPVEKNQIFSPETMAAAELRAAQVVWRLWEGDVAPRPADAAVCSRCSVRDVCRRPAAMPIDELEPDADGAGT